MVAGRAEVGARSLDKANQFVLTIDRLINASDMTQSAMARHLGYSNSNLLTMFKSGQTRVPPEKVAELSILLGANPGEMLRLWFSCYMPEVFEHVNHYVFGDLTPRQIEAFIALRQSINAK